MTTSSRPAAAAERGQQIQDDFFAPDASAPWLFCDRHAPEEVAFRFVDTELRVVDMSYGELGERSRRPAHPLAAQGIGPGDRVGRVLGKGADLPALILGIWRLGAVYVPVFTAFAAAAVAERLHDAGVSVVVTDADQRPKLESTAVTILMANTQGRRTGDESDDLGL